MTNRDPYLEILREWSPNPREMERLLSLFTPEELRNMINELGSPKDVAAFLIHAKKLVNEMVWREEMKSKIGRWAKVFVLASTVIGLINAFVLWMLIKWPSNF